MTALTTATLYSSPSQLLDKIRTAASPGFNIALWPPCRELPMRLACRGAIWEGLVTSIFMLTIPHVIYLHQKLLKDGSRDVSSNSNQNAERRQRTLVGGPRALNRDLRG